MSAGNRTKLVCTIGPASASSEALERLIETGMGVARLNLSHGDFDSHRSTIERIRRASERTGRWVAIMADLPGPKIRIGCLAREPIELKPGASFRLTTEEVRGDAQRATVSFPALARAVSPGDTLFLNDGLIQLRVEAVEAVDVRCTVVVGGELRSHKGLNLPGIELGVSAFTERDRECLEFALDHGVDAVSQSFVSSAADVAAVRQAAAELGYDPFVIAKIERAHALEDIAAILEAADGLMIARGDLGVEIPIERIGVVQKQLMRQANLAGKPVITATQMLASMVGHRRPSRAEATDVANAVLDGTDCLMLSEESATGRYPIEATAMLARIAAETEPTRTESPVHYAYTEDGSQDRLPLVDVITLSIESAARRTEPVAVLVPTESGATARSVARLRLPVRVVAFSTRGVTCRLLQFSWGIEPVLVDREHEAWNAFARDWLRGQGITGRLALLAQGPSPRHPNVDHRLDILDLSCEPTELEG